MFVNLGIIVQKSNIVIETFLNGIISNALFMNGTLFHIAQYE